MSNETTSDQKLGRPVLVTTAHRGVFFGYLDPSYKAGDETVKLSQCRNCPRWRDTRGFLGLASDGPNDKCRVGPPADVELRSITAVVAVTPAAVERWESAPWAR